MKGILALARNDLRLVLRDRMALFWMLVLPVALMWVFGGVGGDRGRPKISLAVVDRDGGWLARAFVEEIAAEPTVSLREIEGGAADAEEGKVRTLVIPEGFTEGVLAGEKQTLRLEKEEGANEEFSFAAQVVLVRVIARTLARLTEAAQVVPADDPGRDEERREAFVAAGEEPALVTVDVATAGEGRPVPSGFQQSVPGILTMTVLMMTLIYGAVFLTLERQSGMLRRQASLPLTRGQVFLGKLGGRLLMAALQCVALLLAGRFLFGLDWGRSALGLFLILASYTGAVAGLATLLGALLRTPEQASSVGWLLSMVLAALGGCWWPAEIMPRWLWTAAHALPTAWAMDGFHTLISFGRGADEVLVPTAVLLGFAVVFSALGARFLRWA